MYDFWSIFRGWLGPALIPLELIVFGILAGLTSRPEGQATGAPILVPIAILALLATVLLIILGKPTGVSYASTRNQEVAREKTLGLSDAPLAAGNPKNVVPERRQDSPTSGGKNATQASSDTKDSREPSSSSAVAESESNARQVAKPSDQSGSGDLIAPAETTGVKKHPSPATEKTTPPTDKKPARRSRGNRKKKKKKP